MPAAPELREVAALIWRIEVQAEFEAHDQSDSDCHVGIAGEIAIDLHRISQHSHQSLDSGIKRRVIKYKIVILRYIIGHYRLFENADDNKPQSSPDFCSCCRLVFLKLRQEIIRPHDGAGNESREKRQEEEIFEPCAGWSDFSLIDIDHITYRLESIEGDSDREDNVERLKVRSDHSVPVP